MRAVRTLTVLTFLLAVGMLAVPASAQLPTDTLATGAVQGDYLSQVICKLTNASTVPTGSLSVRIVNGATGTAVPASDSVTVPGSGTTKIIHQPTTAQPQHFFCVVEGPRPSIAGVIVDLVSVRTGVEEEHRRGELLGPTQFGSVLATGPVNGDYLGQVVCKITNASNSGRIFQVAIVNGATGNAVPASRKLTVPPFATAKITHQSSSAHPEHFFCIVSGLGLAGAIVDLVRLEGGIEEEHRRGELIQFPD